MALSDLLDILVKTPDPRRHTLLEDAYALLIGTVLVTLGLKILQEAHLAIGGTAGVSFIVHYLTDWPLGVVFFVVNLPFYIFAWRALGAAFTIKTFVAVTMLMLESMALPHLVTIANVEPVSGAIAGGILVGMGLLALVRHRASLGGIGVLAIWMQEALGIRAGKAQLAMDATIIAATFLTLDPLAVALSILGAVGMNSILAVNHKPGRYMGM